MAKIKEEDSNKRETKKYNTKVKPTSFQLGDLVLRQSVRVRATEKLSPNWEGSFQVKDVVGKGALKLEKLDGGKILRSWNKTNLPAILL